MKKLVILFLSLIVLLISCPLLISCNNEMDERVKRAEDTLNSIEGWEDTIKKAHDLIPNKYK